MKEEKLKITLVVLGVFLIDFLMYNWHLLANDYSDLAWRIYDLGQSISFAAYIYLAYFLLKRVDVPKWLLSVSFGWFIFGLADIIDEVFFKNVNTSEWEYWILLAFILGAIYHARKKG